MLNHTARQVVKGFGHYCIMFVQIITGKARTKPFICKNEGYPRLTRANTLSGGKKLTLDIVIVLGGRSAHLRPLPRQLKFFLAGKSLGVFRERKMCRTRLTKQAGISPPMRKTKSGAVSAPKNRVCPCQSRVYKTQKVKSILFQEACLCNHVF